MIELELSLERGLGYNLRLGKGQEVDPENRDGTVSDAKCWARAGAKTGAGRRCIAVRAARSGAETRFEARDRAGDGAAAVNEELAEAGASAES